MAWKNTNQKNITNTDVDVSNKVNGYVLQYNSLSGKFESQSLPTISSGGGGTYIIELSRWGISEGIPVKPYSNSHFITADNNIQGINNAIQWAYNNNYIEVCLPRGKYSICYPRSINITQDNMTLNLNGSTLKVIYNSDAKSPLDTQTTGNEYYKFGGNSIVLNGTNNSHILNGTIIGCRDDRSFTNAAEERKVEWTYGVLFDNGASNSSVKHCTIRDFMGDNISFNNDSKREMTEFSLGLTLNNLDATGQPITSSTSVLTQFLNIPSDGTTYTSMTVSGFGYTRLTAINGKEVSMYFYKADGTFIKALLNRKIYSPITIPVGSKKFRIVFNNDTDVNKNMQLTLKFGLSPHHNAIEYNEIFNGHRGGISLGGNYNIVQHNVIRDNGADYVDGKPIFNDPTRYGINQEDSYGDNCTIRNNIIYNTNHGVLLGCYSVEVTNNHIYNVSGVAINLYTLLSAKVRGNFIYNCGSSIGLMSADLQNAHVFVEENTIVGGNSNFASGSGYDVLVRGNTFIDQNNIAMPDTDICSFKDNIIKYSTFYTGSPIVTINRIQGTVFESKTTQRSIIIKAYEFVGCAFANVVITTSTRLATTKREKVVITDCKINNSILDNHIFSVKQRRIEVNNSKFIDSVIRVGNINTNGEVPNTVLNGCEIYTKTTNYIFQSNFNTSKGTIELENCSIEISNATLQSLINNLVTTLTSTFLLSLKKCKVVYVGTTPINLVYYNSKIPMINFVSADNVFSNINLPSADVGVYLGYDVSTKFKKTITLSADGINYSTTVTHNLNTLEPYVFCTSTSVVMNPTVTIIDANSIKITYAQNISMSVTISKI